MAAVDVPDGYVFPASKLLSPEQIAAAGAADAPVAVLATCGSYNPIHTGHLAMFEHAKRTLQAQGAVVAGGFLSPVSDHYKKAGLAAFAPRLRICDAALATNDWISADSWEGLQPQYTRSYIVLSHVAAAVKQVYCAMGAAGEAVVPRLRLYFLCGGDLFETFYKPGVWVLSLLKKIFTDFHLAVVVRDGSNDPHDVMAKSEPLTHKDEPGVVLDLAPFAEKVAIVKLDPPNNASSTELRKRILEGAPFDGMVPKECEAVLRTGEAYPTPESPKA